MEKAQNKIFKNRIQPESESEIPHINRSIHCHLFFVLCGLREPLLLGAVLPRAGPPGGVPTEVVYNLRFVKLSLLLGLGLVLLLRRFQRVEAVQGVGLEQAQFVLGRGGANRLIFYVFSL